MKFKKMMDLLEKIKAKGCEIKEEVIAEVKAEEKKEEVVVEKKAKKKKEEKTEE